MHRTLRVFSLAIGAIIASGALAADARFELSGSLPGAAEWVSVDGDHVAFGSGRRVLVARTTPFPSVESSFETADELAQAILAGGRMYRFGRDGSLAVADGMDAGAAVHSVSLPFRTRGALRVARMDEHLVLAEAGFGLHFLAMPPPPGHAPAHAGHAMTHEVEEVGTLPLSATVRALAASDRRVYAVTEEGKLLVVDASDPAEPLLRREIALEGVFDALAANGSRLYALGPAGLTVLVLDGDSAAVEAVDSVILGVGIEATGRTIHVVSPEQGLERIEDKNKVAATHMVSVTNFTFSPLNLTIALGDTVQWNKASGAGFHNVESCDGASDPPQCMGNVAADGAFTSGAATMSPFTFSHVFTNAGLNRYFCVVHVTAPTPMVGTVTVQAASNPPAVPDGSPGSPLLVNKLQPDGSQLQLTFDVTTCTGNTGHQVVYGFGAQLPASLGGTYGLSGSQCGGTSPLTWSGVPDPAADPKRLLWFVLLATNGSTTEGSWGKDSAGGERTGPGTGGASGQCGTTAKSLTNLCGQ